MNARIDPDRFASPDLRTEDDFSLPGWAYWDPEFFELERQVVFRKSWHLVCHVNDVRAPGDYLTFRFLNESILTVRGTDGVVRSFHNVCRHRAARLLDGEQGNCGKRITCPYHAWTYATDGRLVGLPQRAGYPGMNTNDYGLAEVEQEIWRGFVFVRFAPGLPSVADQMAPYAGELADAPLEELVALGPPREAARLVESVGGHISERVEQGSTEDEFASAYLVVRIPSDQVTDTVEDLKSLGEVQEASLTSTEVTDQVTDLAARIRALEISITRLEDLLGRSGSIEEIVEAERVLTERQSDLEVLLSQQKALADDVSMATFRIDMWTPESEPEPEAPTATGFWPGLVAGWNALVSTINGLLQVIGALIPWLVFAALVTAVVVAIMRRFGRRKASTTPPSAPSPVPFGAGPTTSLPPTSSCLYAACGAPRTRTSLSSRTHSRVVRRSSTTYGSVATTRAPAHDSSLRSL